MKFIASLSVMIIIWVSACRRPDVMFGRMLVEYAEAPVNISQPYPRFTWVVSSEGRNHTQETFRIIVSASEDSIIRNIGEMWDSGTLSSSETIQHRYEGRDLESDHRYYWKVFITDRKGVEYSSPVSSFHTAFLSGDDWQASWIGQGPASEKLPEEGFYAFPEKHYGLSDTVSHSGRSLLLRKEIEIHGKVQSVRIMVTGLGFYEFFVNGHRVGDNVLSPAKTPYHKYVLYDTYDITQFINEGCNTFGLHLGNGWYNPYKKWWRQYRMQWFGFKKAVAQINVTFNDGSSLVIPTDTTWKYAPGPLIFSCIYDGEIRDSNLELQAWSSPGFDDNGWKPVTVFDSVGARLVSLQMPPAKVNEIFKPVPVGDATGPLKVFDMGQNFAGWVRLTVEGEKDTRIRIRFAEDIKEDGSLDPSSNENAGAKAEYIMCGRGEEVYEPSFTYFGFRYVEISSAGKPYKLKNIEGRAVYSVNRNTGQFYCSDTLVNRIHNAAVWSQKSNMIGYPMDCPQRDERLGWLGDAQVSAEQAMFNFDMALFYRNWLEGIKENQDEKTGDIPIISPQPYMPDEGVEWSSTYIIMLWQFYVNYGDKAILAHHYPAMKRYMEFLSAKAGDNIIAPGWIGDWGSLVKGWKEGRPESVPTAFYLLDGRIMAKVAGVLDKPDDKNYYNDLAGRIEASYNEKFLRPLSGTYLDGTQMDNAFPLWLGIVPGSVRTEVLNNLVDDIRINNDTHLTTGVLGTKYLPEVLAVTGNAGLAWELITRKTYPSWYEMVKRYTTMCEFWTLKQSKNHVMMGSIDAWFYKYLAGITPDENNPAWSQFSIKPFVPAGLNYANARVETIRGTISSGWRIENDMLILEAEVPFNTSAVISIPSGDLDIVTESGRDITSSEDIQYLGYSDMYHQVKVGSGKYIFKVRKGKVQ
jgi:alpha-L-rhamnosidase